jgi:putative redox protein
MAVEIDTEYIGELRCGATHGPSGVTLNTDAPTDNGGKGASFSPTDLMATSMGTCIMTILALVAERNGVDLKGAKVHVTKKMITEPIRRIGGLPAVVTIPSGAVDDPVMRKKLEAAARNCPVHHSLHPDIDAPIEFLYL